MITRSDVEHAALLSRLTLTEEEKEVFTGQLNDILEHIGLLSRLNTEDVLPTIHVLPMQNVFRDDQVGRHMSQEDAVSNCADHDKYYFKVPKIL